MTMAMALGFSKQLITLFFWKSHIHTKSKNANIRF
jgi:hypothetical protein